MTDLFGQPDPIIRVVDFECTGLTDDALVCEVGYTDLNPVTRMVGATHSYLCRVDQMTPDTRAIHHIRASDTAGLPPYDRRILHERTEEHTYELQVIMRTSYDVFRLTKQQKNKQAQKPN